MEASQWSLAVCIVMCSQWVTVVDTSCDQGWFGDRCQYKCRCRNDNCDLDGSCKSGVTCQGGWFGPACQYADIAYRKSKDASHSAVVDGDDITCLNKVDSNFIKIDLRGLFWLTWLRVRVSKPEFLLTVEINFGNNETCAQNVTVDRHTLDLHCDLKQTIQYIYISGEGRQFLCSLYVSGGRNVALRQSASQSSTLMVHYEGTDVYFLANNSVDGNSDTRKSDSCSITKGDVPFPRWNVSFTHPRNVYWIVLYIRDKGVENPNIINTFKLQAFDKDGAVIFSSSHIHQNIITIQRKLFGTKVVSITANNSQNTLNICEVEVYGDSHCEPDRYGRDCELRCNCAGSEPCFVSTGGCPSGCAVGFQGENCNQKCPDNTYGKECAYNCSQFCVENSTCDHVSGACFSGCVDGFRGLTCLEPCPNNTYGKECAFNCSQFCVKNSTNPQSCDQVSGACFSGCLDGFRGLTCLEPCPANTYGKECAFNCSQFCVKNSTNPQSCDQVSGACFDGCVDGFRGLTCHERIGCDSENFGDQCQYKCQCEAGNCTMDGSCESGVTCQGGWFGPACQYADIAYNKSTVSSHSVVVDGDDSTCLKGVNSTFIKFDLDGQFLLTWLRVRLSKKDLLPTLFVSFGNNGSVECTAARKTTVDEIMDLYCDMNQTIQYIRVSGDGMHYLCSLYVSGGRDILAGQNVSKTSHYVGPTDVGSALASRKKREPGSLLAENKKNKKRTVQIYNSNWRTSFTRPYSIKRVVFSKKGGRESFWLTEFILRAFDKDGAETFRLEDKRLQMITFYNVWIPPINAYTVSIAVNHSENILKTIYAEVYGDTICETDRFGKDCEHRCNCAGSEPCFVSTGGCPSGCAVGFQGPQCKQECKENTYGHRCTSKCSPFCVQNLPNPQSCHHVSGACFHECVSGYMGNTCQQQLPEDNRSNLTAVWGVLAVICGLLVLVFIYVYMGRRRRKEDQLLLRSIDDYRVGYIRSEKRKKPKTTNESDEDFYATLPDYVHASANGDNQDEKLTDEEIYEKIKDSRSNSEATSSEIYDDTDCYNQIYNSTSSLEGNIEEERTDISIKQETTESSIKSVCTSPDAEVNICYRKMQNFKQKLDAPCPIRGEQQNSGEIPSEIYDDTVVSVYPYNSERSSAQNDQEVRTDITEERTAAEDSQKNMYDVPENCKRSDNICYTNMPDVQQPTDTLYEHLIELQQNREATSSGIHDDQAGYTQPNKKKRSLAECNQEVRAEVKSKQETADDVIKNVYHTLQTDKPNNESGYRNIQDVQQSLEAPYTEIN